MVVQQLDDRNPSIVYSVAWQTAGISPEFDNTTTWTNITGSIATVTFFGTSISVWGTIPSADIGISPKSSYSIDSELVSTFTGTQISTTQYNQRFYQSDQLNPTNHTLNIVTLVNGGYYYLDYVFIVTPDSSTLTSASSSTSLDTSPTSQVTLSPSSKKNLPIGAVVGGVLGAVALLALTMISILLLRKKTNNRRKDRQQKPEITTSLWSKIPNTTTGLTPFIIHSYRPIHSTHYGSEYQPDSSLFFSSPRHLQDPHETYRSTSSASTSQSANLTNPSTAPLLALRDHLPTSKSAALLESRGVPSSSGSRRPHDYYDTAPPNYND